MKCSLKGLYLFKIVKATLKSSWLLPNKVLKITVLRSKKSSGDKTEARHKRTYHKSNVHNQWYCAKQY